MKTNYSTMLATLICALCAPPIVMADFEGTLLKTQSTLFFIGIVFLTFSLEVIKYKLSMLIPACFLFAVAEFLSGATDGVFFLPQKNCIFCGILHTVAGVMILLIALNRIMKKKEAAIIAKYAIQFTFIVYAFNAAVNLWAGNEIANDVKLWAVTFVFGILSYSSWNIDDIEYTVENKIEKQAKRNDEQKAE